ncbi:MAG: rod shape-determining protein [Proteobacteria bacterium]|nr:rod shape-determining protein [Pseudomonadota bacterium]MBU1638944.1 rod shape-determining protein [Pseudomonadota bacterium]
MEETSTTTEAVAASTSGKITVGIDLGTCRTAIMSDRGAKLLARSVVGYPKDIISEKMVGKGPIFGDEAMEKRNFLDLCYPLADGVIREASERDYKAAYELLGHLVELAKKGENVEVCGIIGVPARASIMNKELLLTIAEKFMSKALVVSEPFMVAYQLGNLTNCIVIDIGAGTVDICGMKGTVPIADDQVTFLKGGDYIDERLCQSIIRHYPGVQMTNSVACSIKEKFASVDGSKKALVTLRHEGKPMEFDVTADVNAVCESIVPDICEHIENLIQKFDPADQEATLKNIVLAGGGSRISGLAEMIAEHLAEYGEIKVTAVQDPEFVGCAGALKLATEIPEDMWSQIGVMFDPES